MKKCRECGKKLKIQFNQKELDVARSNIKHLKPRLELEGEFMTDYQRKSCMRILYESELRLDNEVSYDDAICEDCRSKMTHTFDLSKKSWMDPKEIKEKSDRFNLYNNIDAIIKNRMKDFD